jgi:hypothetical protein
MNTSRLVLAVVTIVLIPAVVSVGCNKKEDEALAPSASAPPPPPPEAPPPATATEAPKPVVVAKPGVKTDGGVAKADAAVVILTTSDGGKVAIPTIPVIPVSAIPGAASALAGAIISAIPTNLIPPPAAPRDK